MDSKISNFSLSFCISSSTILFGAFVTSILLVLITRKKNPSFFRNISQLSMAIFVWSGCAMSTYTTSTFPNTEKYSLGFLASCSIGMTFAL